MDRRGIFRGMLAAAGLVSVAKAQAAEQAGALSFGKVAYHVPDIDKVGFALTNIGNHYAGMGGPEKVRIALVILGPAMKAVTLKEAPPNLAPRVADLASRGLELWACINTMNAMKLELTDLLPGFKVADKGGVVKVAELQSQGWCYIRA